MIEAARDKLIVRGKIRGLTSGEIAYQKGYADGGRLVGAERESSRIDRENWQRERDTLRTQVDGIAKCRKAADARRAASEILKIIDRLPRVV
jgi:hypothetical protein